MAARGEAVLAGPYDDIPQQQEASALGMWLFLATEVMFFGVMIAGYAVYRYLHAAGFGAAGHHMNKPLGTLNTAILLTSSLTVAMAVSAAKRHDRTRLWLCTAATALLGLVFDGLKLYEYHEHYKEHLLPVADFHFPGADAKAAELFFVLYYVMTGVHALHVAIGIGLFTVLTVLVLRGRYTRGDFSTIENSGLYWHFVDLVWIFLYPLFYFAGGAS